MVGVDGMGTEDDQVDAVFGFIGRNLLGPLPETDLPVDGHARFFKPLGIPFQFLVRSLLQLFDKLIHVRVVREVDG